MKKPKTKKKIKPFDLEKDKQKIVIANLRKASQYWTPINMCRKHAKVGIKRYQCSICGAIVEKVAIDHIRAVVPIDGIASWDEFINNLFCDVDNLQALCKDCHDIKTKEENKLRKKYKDERKIHKKD